jgi:hypothetical protein
MTTAMLAEAVGGASAGLASLIVLALVLLVAFGCSYRCQAAGARPLRLVCLVGVVVRAW